MTRLGAVVQHDMSVKFLHAFALIAEARAVAIGIGIAIGIVIEPDTDSDTDSDSWGLQADSELENAET